MSQGEPYLRVVWTDPETGRHGYVVIDRLVRGISGGGTRVRRGVTLEEVERLARTMTYKNGALNVPSGGAKSGLDCDLSEPGGRDLLVRFVRAMLPLLQTRWATAEDMGVTQEELDSVFEEVGLGLSVYAGLKATGDFDGAMALVRRGLSVKVEGIGLADLIGGYGVAEAAAAALEHLGRPIQGTRAVVQGFGSMGGGTARYLARSGVKVVGVLDVHGCVVNPEGLDVERLLANRSAAGDIDRASLPSGTGERPREEWLDIDCEILVPAALGDVLTEANADAVRASVVVEAANIPTTEAAGRRLHERGVVVVPDFVANSAANGWWWSVMMGIVAPTEQAAYEWARATIRGTVRRLLLLSQERGVTPREAAEAIAVENTNALAEEYGTEEPVTSAQASM
ncbi:MAG TPA: Glu/Leu/Phe/Val dehydrogenase dimerization domain-containing protein [Candidatus Dormibacteraeota bacterium]